MLSEEDISLEAEWVDEKLRVVLANVYEAGSDITDMLKNASFADGFNGWSGTIGTGTAQSPTNDYYGAECLNKGFNMYQTLTGLTNGVYVISVTAAYRPFNDPYSNYYAANIYMNENKIFMPTVYETRISTTDAQDGVNCYLTQNGSDGATDIGIYDEKGIDLLAYAINGKTSIANAAAGERALNYIVANVTDGTLTIGFANPNASAKTDWTGVSNIHLLYAGSFKAAEHYLDETLVCMVARANTIINNIPNTDTGYAKNPNCPQEIKDKLQQAVNAVATVASPEEKYELIGTFSSLWDEYVDGREAYIKLLDEALLCEGIAYELVRAGKMEETNEVELGNIFSPIWTGYEMGSFTTEQALSFNMLKDAGLIPATDENSTYQIASNYDMAYYCAKAGVAGKAVNGKLLVDIDYFTENQMMENFYGVFDGDYHTITVDIHRTARGAALINNMRDGACVKNLTIRGDVYNNEKFCTAVCANTYNQTSILNITSYINAHSSFTGSAAHGGIMSCSRGATYVANCVFAGTMEGTGYNNGGIVAWTNSSTGFTQIENCLQIADISLSEEGAYTISMEPDYLSIANCYYKTPFGTPQGTQVTDEQLASGEVCYLLNEGNTDNPAWYQTIGVDPFPVPDPHHKKVGKKADGTYTNDESQWEIIAPQPQPTTPVADLLDVVFHEDGTAEDISPMKNEIELIGETTTTYYNDTYQRYVAHFDQPYAGTCTGYYKTPTFNSATRKALSDGHSLELLCMIDYDDNIVWNQELGENIVTIPDKEVKPFSAMGSGGTGFLISTISGPRQNELTFLPKVTASGANTWRWTTSGVVPHSKTFYHLVGVFNKEEQKTYIYVNGELKNTVDAPGMFRYATQYCNWLAIGGDPASATDCEASWRGDIAIARAYDKPLTKEDVDYLWEKIQYPVGIGVLKPAKQAPIGIYNLNGVRQAKPQKGINIIDGNKVLVK